MNQWIHLRNSLFVDFSFESTRRWKVNSVAKTGTESPAVLIGVLPGVTRFYHSVRMCEAPPAGPQHRFHGGESWPMVPGFSLGLSTPISKCARNPHSVKASTGLRPETQVTVPAYAG